jgi:LysR family transcriptional regulator, low CO2-responsive transcriptional regulator
MNYTLHQLAIFSAIARTKSITKAAEELNLSQPAVSIQLRNLQEQFEIPLTEVIGKRLYLTEFGLQIADAANRIIAEADEIRNTTMAYKGQLTGKLSFSVVSTGKYVIPYFLSDFMKLNPGVDLMIDVSNRAGVLNAIENNKVDFALIPAIPPQLKVNKIDLMDNHLHLIANSDFSTGKQPYKTLELKQLPLIYREQGSSTRMLMERFIQQARLKIKPKMELTSNEAVKQSVIAGLGLSIMPLIGIRNELLTGLLKIVTVQGLPIVTKWSLIWPHKKVLSPVSMAFTTHLEKRKKEIIKEHFGNILSKKISLQTVAGKNKLS